MRSSRTASFVVVAAALALVGLMLAEWARGLAARAGDGARQEAAASADRVGVLVQTAMSTARLRAQDLAATPTVRAAVETDVATVRDMARAEGSLFSPAAGETIELFQLPGRGRLVSLLRAPEGAPPTALHRTGEVSIRADAARQGLVVTVAAPVEPLYAHGTLKGAVAISTRIDPTMLLASLAASGLSAELDGLDDEPLPLTTARIPEGAGALTASVPLPSEAVGIKLVLRAGVRSRGGALLWAGRALLGAALLAALLAFAEHRRQREMVLLDDAPTARQDTRLGAPVAAPFFERFDLEHDAPLTADDNAPLAPIAPEPTVRDKAHTDGNHLMLAWRANMPTPITQLRPQESLPIVVDPRGDELSGRYRLLQPIGRGSAADVYLAQALVRGAPATVALKLLQPGRSPARDRYLETARRQMWLSHSNIVQVKEVRSDAIGYVAMEYVEGCTLEVLLRDLLAREEPLPLPQAVAIVAAICRALDVAHGARDDRGALRPLVHGALKPTNVLVGRHNFIKLGDFGAPPSPGDRHAPEQYAGNPPDRRSDIYAVGVILHELVTAHRVELATSGGTSWPPLPAPSSLRSELPRGLDALVAKATRFSPRGRYATAGELHADLARVTGDAAQSASPAWLGDWVDRARRSS